MLPQELDNNLLLARQHEDESDNDLSTGTTDDSLDSSDSLSPTSTVYNDDHPEAYKSVPLVFVTGFLAPSWKKNWGPLEKLQDTMIKDTHVAMAKDPTKLRSRVFLHVTPGMCSSVHDRACEIFFQLKGGKGKWTGICSFFLKKKIALERILTLSLGCSFSRLR